MSAQSAIRAGRRAAESLMTDTFTAYAPTGTTAINATTGLPERVFEASGATHGKVTVTSGQVGDAANPEITAGLHLPLYANPKVGMEYQCVALGPVSPGGLLGKRYRVAEVPAKSLMTAYRLDVVEVTADEIVTRLRAGTSTDPFSALAEENWSTATSLQLVTIGPALPITSAESVLAGRNPSTFGFTVKFDPSVDVTGRDRLLIRGDIHQIDGEPERWPTHTVVRTTRLEG